MRDKGSIKLIALIATLSSIAIFLFFFLLFAGIDPEAGNNEILRLPLLAAIGNFLAWIILWLLYPLTKLELDSIPALSFAILYAEFLINFLFGKFVFIVTLSFWVSFFGLIGFCIAGFLFPNNEVALSYILIVGFIISVIILFKASDKVREYIDRIMNDSSLMMSDNSSRKFWAGIIFLIVIFLGYLDMKEGAESTLGGIMFFIGAILFGFIALCLIFSSFIEGGNKVYQNKVCQNKKHQTKIKKGKKVVSARVRR